MAAEALGYDAAFFDQHVKGSLASARVVLDALLELVNPRSVVDVGCGVAPWLSVAHERGATEILGLDGDYVDRSRVLVPPDSFLPCDLETGRLPSDRRFDLALCMEVAEHLSAARAPSFIAELCRLSDLVLFSAAVPNQGGTHHINEQWPGYWSDLFANHGYDCFDLLRSRLWQQDECEWWYLQNVLLFVRRDSDAATLMSQHGHPVPTPMALVHPRFLAQRSSWLEQSRAEAIEAGRQAVHAKEVELAALLQANAELRQTNADLHQASAARITLLERELQATSSVVDALHGSTSWRITAPLRHIVACLQGRTRLNPPG